MHNNGVEKATARQVSGIAAFAKQLHKVLASVGESSRFVTAGEVAPVLPGLEVRGAGQIAIPVTAAAAKRLIEQATPAPYGRGEETIIDPTIRRVWQVEPSQFLLRNREWDALLARIVAGVTSEFGISQKVDAGLYKLLVYEKGSFFARHRDSEKTPGMFATLVVCLPSRHEGGTLRVSHDGQTTDIDFGGTDAEFQVQYAAFYADCEHEVTPVTAGYRVCIVYNLTIARRKRQPAAPRTGRAVDELAAILAQFFADQSLALDRIAIPLAHQYTELAFHPRALKGGDRSRADVLMRAAAQADCHAHLALLTHYQMGEADYNTWHARSSWSRRSRYGSYDDDDDDVDDSAVEMGEVDEEARSLDCWFDATGRKRTLGPMQLSAHEILGRETEHERSFTQEVHEATGNEGVTVERWYRQAAVVIWPRDRYFSILAGEGQATAIPVLAELVASAKQPAGKAACRAFAEQIIEHWQPRQRLSPKAASCSAHMLALLHRLAAPELARSFLSGILPYDFDGSEGSILSRICGRIGWPESAAELKLFFAMQQPEDSDVRLAHVISIFEGLCTSAPAPTKERRTACAALALEVEQLVNRWDGYRGSAWLRKQENRQGIPEQLILAYSAVQETDRLERFVSHVLEDSERYGLHAVLIPAVKELHDRLQPAAAGRASYVRLRQHCMTELRRRTARPVEQPADWSRAAELGCNCTDCKELSTFLSDPEAHVHRFRIRKDRRQHLHQQIERNRCDVTHVTERRGSPQTLVCTKTQASYERRLQQFATDSATLRELKNLDGE